jgi:glutathione peroxidase-family protein
VGPQAGIPRAAQERHADRRRGRLSALTHVRTTRPGAIGTDEVKWNFTKVLIDREGNVIRRYEPTVTPQEIRADLDPLLSG